MSLAQFCNRFYQGQVRPLGDQIQNLDRELFQRRNAPAARLRGGAPLLIPALQPLYRRRHLFPVQYFSGLRVDPVRPRTGRAGYGLISISLLSRIAACLKQFPAYLNGGIPSRLGMRESLRIDSPFMGAGMPKAYSRDLRERVITAVETGASRREAAERFEVSAGLALSVSPCSC